MQVRIYHGTKQQLGWLYNCKLYLTCWWNPKEKKYGWKEILHYKKDIGNKTNLCLHKLSLKEFLKSKVQ